MLILYGDFSGMIIWFATEISMRPQQALLQQKISPSRLFSHSHRALDFSGACLVR